MLTLGENGDPSPNENHVTKIMTDIEKGLNDPTIEILHYNTNPSGAAALLAKKDHEIFRSSGDGYKLIKYRDKSGEESIITIGIDREVDPENKNALLKTIKTMLLMTNPADPVQIDFTSLPRIPKNPKIAACLKKLG